MQQNRVWRLAKRPVGAISEGDLRLNVEALAPLNEGEVRIKVLYLSLDPTNRIWMSDREQYMPPVALNAPMRGGIAGVVCESRHPHFAVGAKVAGLGVWADYITSDGAMLSHLPSLPGIPMAAVFGVLGMISATAYFGLLDIAKPKEGECVVVSAAAGAVGSLVGQIAKIKGCHVVGIAGSAQKCHWIKDELGFDGAINYNSEDVGAALDRLCPKGIDVNFENVGGEIMEAVMQRMNLHARMVLCGLISGYNAVDPVPGPKAWPLILMRRLMVQGFIVTDYAQRFAESAQQVALWIMEGRIKYRLDVREGLENAVIAVQDLYSGANQGKLLVRVADES
jgi:NADPH-dependent curcumin reductase